MSVLITKNSEYTIVNDTCTAVRSLVTQSLLPAHPAIGQKVLGALCTRPGLSYSQSPTIGMSVVFSSDIITSPLVDMRPA